MQESKNQNLKIGDPIQNVQGIHDINKYISLKQI